MEWLKQKQTRMPILMRWGGVAHISLGTTCGFLFLFKIPDLMPSFTRHFVEKDLFGKPRDHILVEGKSVLSPSAYAYLLAFAYAEMLL